MLLSPAKTLDEQSPVRWAEHSQPALLSHTAPLVKALKKQSPESLGALMGISEKLAALNAERFRAFHTPFTPENARPALALFKGDVYTHLRAESFSAQDAAFAQAHLRILSGLYGLLRPLDLIQPYRLEMGTRLSVGKTKELYAYWKMPLVQALNTALAEEGSGVVLNLASEEYFKAVDAPALKATVITAHFKERRGNHLQTIGLLAKRARGAMARYVITERIQKVNKIKAFNEEGYALDADLSDTHNLVFVR